VLEHPERIERLGVRGGKIDVPLAVNVMQFRRPNQLAHWAGVGFTPDHHLFGMRKPSSESARRIASLSYSGTEAIK
jgi:hypothetical protein